MKLFSSIGARVRPPVAVDTGQSPVSPGSRPVVRRGGLALACAVALALGLSALPAAGTSGSENRDPAAIAPADSVFYVDARLDPEGEQEQWVRDIVAKFPGRGAAGARVPAVLDDALRGLDRGLSFKADVRPWLGARAGGFASITRNGDAAGALILSTKSEKRAATAIRKLVGRARRSYGGVEYGRRSGLAAGIVQRFAVVGNERGLRDAIDAARQRSLAASRAYRAAIADLPRDRIAGFYLDARSLLRAAARSGPLGSGIARSLLGAAAGRPLTASLRVEQNALVVDGELPRLLGVLASPLLGSGTPIVSTLPNDSWLAAGQPDFGRTAARLINATTAGLGGIDRKFVEREFRHATRLDLDRDLLEWMGDLGFFLRGTTKGDLGGGVVIESRDAAASLRALRRIAVILHKRAKIPVTRATLPAGGEGFTFKPDALPEPVHAVQRNGRLTIAYGDDSANLAVSGTPALATAPNFATASAGLGDGYEVSNYLSVYPLRLVLKNVANLDHGDYLNARAYLAPLDHLVAGTATEDKTIRSRTRLTFK